MSEIEDDITQDEESGAAINGADDIAQASGGFQSNSGDEELITPDEEDASDNGDVDSAETTGEEVVDSDGSGAGEDTSVSVGDAEDNELGVGSSVSLESGESGDADEAEINEEDDDFELSGDEGFAMPLVQVVEAILFAADEAVGIEKIAKAAGKRIRREAVVEAINELQKIYQESERAFEIVEVAEKFQMLTRAEFSRNVQAFYGKKAIKEEKDKKISPVALDTLAIIAYKQPVTRAEVEAVRGVGCGQVMRQLMERGSIRPVGKKMDVIGYPLLYGTTDQFLKEFGLASLDILPMAAELRRLTKVELPKPEVVEGEGESAGKDEELDNKLEGAVVIESNAESEVETSEEDVQKITTDNADLDDREDI